MGSLEMKTGLERGMGSNENIPRNCTVAACESGLFVSPPSNVFAIGIAVAKKGKEGKNKDREDNRNS